MKAGVNDELKAMKSINLDPLLLESWVVGRREERTCRPHLWKSPANDFSEEEVVGSRVSLPSIHSMMEWDVSWMVWMKVSRSVMV